MKANKKLYVKNENSVIQNAKLMEQMERNVMKDIREKFQDSVHTKHFHLHSGAFKHFIN